ARGQRRDIGSLGGAELARLADEHVAPGQEFERRRIGSGFGLDEHGTSGEIRTLLKYLSLGAAQGQFALLCRVALDTTHALGTYHDTRIQIYRGLRGDYNPGPLPRRHACQILAGHSRSRAADRRPAW